MSNIGLQVLNNNDSLMIDSHYHNLGLFKKINKNQMKNLGNTKYDRPEYRSRLQSKNYRSFPVEPMVRYQYEIPQEVKFPVVAIDAFTGFNFCGGIASLRGKKYIEIYTNNPNNFNVYIYSTGLINHVNFGLEVYNEKGETVFDSENGYMKMLESLDKNKRCGVVLLGVIKDLMSTAGMQGFQFFINAFRIENNTLRSIRIYHIAFETNWRVWRAVGKPKYNTMPYIIDVSHH